MINLKKIYFIFFLILTNYFLITAIIFSFSYISIINGKTYDWFWVKSIQKKIYFDGLRNIWQYDKSCATFDKNLLYKPINGKCYFVNPEFKTELNFDDYTRIHNSFINNNYDKKDYLVVLGDSVSMGWGVNDQETFSYLLEQNLKKNVFNMSVSSYGTVREVKRFKNSPYYTNSKTIIVQYHPNDLDENKNLKYNRIYLNQEFENIFKEQAEINKIYYILGLYKSSLRLFFSDILDIIFREDNLELIDFEIDKIFLENILRNNIDIRNKRVIVILVVNPWQKIINFPNYNKDIEYLKINLEKSDFFIIDDHPNINGHMKISSAIDQYLKN